MAQLYYRYSTMNAGKSLEIIKVANNYEELGKRVMCLVPEVDDRYERDMVTSRVGLSHKAYTVDDDTNIMTLFIEKNMRHQIDCVLVDECQFSGSIMCRNWRKSWTASTCRYWPTD